MIRIEYLNTNSTIILITVQKSRVQKINIKLTFFAEKEEIENNKKKDPTAAEFWYTCSKYNLNKTWKFPSISLSAKIFMQGQMSKKSFSRFSAKRWVLS